MKNNITSNKEKIAVFYERNGYPAYIAEDTSEEWEYLEEYNNEHDAWDRYYAESCPEDETIENLRQIWEDLNEV